MKYFKFCILFMALPMLTAKSTEVEIDWGSSIEQAELQVHLIDRDTIYWVSPTNARQLERGANLRTYKLPHEIRGRCLFSLFMGSHSSRFGYYRVCDIDDSQAAAKLAFPRTSVLFDLEIADASCPSGDKVIVIFRSETQTAEVDPYFYFVAPWDAQEGSKKSVGLMFADPCRFRICLEMKDEGSSIHGKRIYDKQIAVGRDMLFERPAYQSGKPSQAPKPIAVEFTSKDRFKGGVGPAVVSPPSVEVKLVSPAGEIEAVIPPPAPSSE